MDDDNSVWKYDGEEVDKSSEEYIRLKLILQKARCEESKGTFEWESVDIWKLEDTILPVSFEEYSGNLMLLHGTSDINATEILKKGFVNSQYGYFGKGLYMTECSDMACHYSNRKMSWKPESRYETVTNCIFYNEVIGSQYLDIKKYDSYMDLKNIFDHANHPFRKYMHKSSPETIKQFDYTTDDQARYYRCKKMTASSLADEYVADAVLIKPRYLILLKVKVDKKQYDSFLEFFRAL